MLHIHTANRYELLTAQLSARLAGARVSVLVPDHIIVPSAAIRRRVTLDLARDQRICANLQFDYLASWLWKQIAAVVPGVGQASPFAAPVLAWRILAEFETPDWQLPFPRLAAWLREADAVMVYELAVRVASLFDQYTTYRPEWLGRWRDGEMCGLTNDDGRGLADEAWQAELWRRILAGIGGLARDPAESFEHALAETALVKKLPAQVHVFCLPIMPPLHLHLLQALARRIDVYLYALNPCREYWFDVVSDKTIRRLASTARHDYQESGHRLLAAWGGQTQSFLAMLNDATGGEPGVAMPTQPYEGLSLLARLQNSILELADLNPGELAGRAPDDSIEIHVCHSMTREIEVLHDRLLARFAQAHDALTPADVLVVTPDLEAAAPLVDAVFGTAPAELVIPYAITGRPRSKVNSAARLLLDLLELLTSRFAVTAVTGLLQRPMLARRFGIDGAGQALLHGWLEASGVHWARDAEHRASLGLPALAAHSFADGLERLFLGYALPDSITLPFNDRMGAGHVEGSQALTLGAFWRFMTALTELRQAVATPLAAARWPALLAEILDAFAQAEGDELDEVFEVRDALALLGEQFERSELSADLPLDVVRRALEGMLDDPARGGVPTGSVTFSSLSSLRNLPYRMVCVIGLNDSVFPSPVRPDELDLMTRDIRVGDRQRRRDERNLLLDLILAARDRLYLGYVGKSVRDDASLPPSVLISQLLDYLVPALTPKEYDVAALNAVMARLVIQHPLQPFSETAFRADSDQRLRSFRSEYAQALSARTVALSRAATASSATAASGTASALEAVESEQAFIDDDEDDVPKAVRATFFDGPLPAAGDEWLDVPLTSLVRFFRNPSRYLLVQRLGLSLPRAGGELSDDEPFALDIPTRSALAKRLLPLLIDGMDRVIVRTIALSGTQVPIGALGRQMLEEELDNLQAFAARFQAASHTRVMSPRRLSVDVPVNGRVWHVHGQFNELRETGLLRYRYDDRRASDYLEAWLHHLLLCADLPPGVPPVTQVLARDGDIVFEGSRNGGPILADLLRAYDRGLSEPLPFFPKAAWAYCSKGKRLADALSVWRVTPFRAHGEAADPAYRLAFRGRPADPVEADSGFTACALQVFGPLWNALEDAHGQAEARITTKRFGEKAS